MLDALGQEINIANEELKSIYLKLYSKCSLLLKKVCYIMDDSHKYALDFKIYDINEKQNIDTYNEEFDALFEGLYQKRNISNIARNYQNKFRSNEFSTKGFIILSHYYRTETKDCNQIANLIWRFNKFYVTRKKKNNLSDFDRYALECVRLYLHNSQFSLNIEQPKYSIEQLKTDLEKIRRIQVDTQIWNYHPYYKSLDFLSRLIKNNELIQNEQYCSHIDDIISLHESLLSSYKKCIDWCSHRTFYPFQLEHADCISSGDMFCASTFAVPLNIKDLKAFYRKSEGDHQVLIMQGNYINNRRELNEIQQKITSYRKETFEYIGIFIAIITFLFGSLQIFGAKLDWHQSITSIVSLGSVLCIFGVILSASFNEKWPLWGKFTFYALIILISILFIIFSPLILSVQTP